MSGGIKGINMPYVWKENSDIPIKKDVFFPKCSHNIFFLALIFFFHFSFFLYGNEDHAVGIGSSCVYTFLDNL